jgi:hypothetical protein
MIELFGEEMVWDMFWDPGPDMCADPDPDADEMGTVWDMFWDPGPDMCADPDADADEMEMGTVWGTGQ